MLAQEFIYSLWDNNEQGLTLTIMLLLGPAQESRQKEFEQERLSSLADSMEYFIE